MPKRQRNRTGGPTWEPSQVDYQRVLAEQNPWKITGEAPASWAPPVERPLTALLTRCLQTADLRRFQLVLGPRRVGKTTCLYQTVRQLLLGGVAPRRIWWLRLDHPLLMQLDLGLLLGVVRDGVEDPNEPAFVFLDELTYARDWDLWLKTFHDERWPLRIAGSSSATAALRERRLESGVGRWEEQYLAPYLLGEFLDLVEHETSIPLEATLSATVAAVLEAGWDPAGIEPLRRRLLLTGGFPELLVAAGAGKDDDDEVSMLLRSQQTLRNDAVERAIYKDIPQAFGIDNPMMLERLLYTLAGQITGLLSPQRLCQELDGLSQPTFDRYLSYLERAFLVFTLPNYSGREGAVQRRGRRLYFVDGAVRNAALQRGAGPLTAAEEMGLLYENLVAGHLHALARQTQVRLYHWREGNHEVDLIYDHPEQPLAFEIASSVRHPVTGLQRFMERFPRFKGRCYVVSPEPLGMLPGAAANHVGRLPLDLLLLAASRQAETALERRLIS
ncbi:MAG: ATP-binding protein [Acidobacteria bacterium]|nr:ATP-binding protein [Acidobacteriota bacterium]